MHGIGTIGAHSVAPPSQGVGMNALSNQAGSGFQFASLTNAASQSAAKGVSSTAPPSLGSQTVSTLLQTQDLNQTQARGGGHGCGGGHHGGMKLSSLEAEEAAESEEAQPLRQRKKLTKTTQSANASETVEVDENGVVVGDVGQAEESTQQDKEGGVNS